MRTRLIATVIFTVALLPALTLRSAQSPARNIQSAEAPQHATSTDLSLRFIEPAHAFASDAELEVEVELKNEGSQTVLVCRNLDVGVGNSRPCSWEFPVRYPPGREPHSGCESAADGGYRPNDDFSSILIRNWMALSPEDSYRTHIKLRTAFCHKPSPGRYQITGLLTSYGLGDNLAMDPHEIEKLPYPIWKGTIISNKLWITINPPQSRNR
jgi:hypothetical protein